MRKTEGKVDLCGGESLRYSSAGMGLALANPLALAGSEQCQCKRSNVEGPRGIWGPFHI